MKAPSIPLDYVPTDAADLKRGLADPMWRLCSGQLYKIMVKEGEGAEGTVVPFRPNRVQRRLISKLWHRNVILKARQLGFTTLVAILWLDHALFIENQRCGIIAQDREAAEAIFRDKVKLAYDHLPAALKAIMPLARDSASELLFGHNNSSIRVATSMRSGTIHRLHVSEFGKICAKFPDKAKEVVTGSLPAVPLGGITIIESTAEGREGEFFRMTQKAMAVAQQGKELTERDCRFHFFPWWEAPEYRVEARSVLMTQKDREYFERIESLIGQDLEPEQRAWYVATRDNDFGGGHHARGSHVSPRTPDGLGWQDRQRVAPAGHAHHQERRWLDHRGQRGPVQPAHGRGRVGKRRAGRSARRRPARGGHGVHSERQECDVGWPEVGAARLICRGYLFCAGGGVITPFSQSTPPGACCPGIGGANAGPAVTAGAGTCCPNCGATAGGLCGAGISTTDVIGPIIWPKVAFTSMPSVTRASGSSTTPATRPALDVVVRASRSVGHFRKAMAQGTSRPTTGTNISSAQAPLNPARCRMRQVGTTSSAIKGVIISRTMNQCAGLNVPMARSSV